MAVVDSSDSITSPWRQDMRQLVALTLPILCTQICQSGLSLVDTVMAGQVSARDLAGVAIGAGVWLPVFLLLVGVLLSTTPLIGEMIGQKHADQNQQVRFITQQSLWLALVLGVLGILAVNQLYRLFGVMGVPSEIAPIAREFLRGISFGLPAVCAYTSLRCYTESLKQPVVVTVISLIGLLLNIPLNYLFIHGIAIGDRQILPALGGAGCGYASAATLWLNLIMLGGYLSLTPRQAFSQTRFYQQFAAAKLSQLGKQLRLGIPIGLSVFFEVSAFSLAALIISPLGEIAVASHQVAITVSSQLFMLPFSLATALTILVSNRYGAQDFVALRRMAWLGLTVATALALGGTTIIALLREKIPAWFSHDPAVIAKSATLLWFAMLYQIVDAWQVNFAGILRGIQDTTVPMVITLISYWLVAIPLGWYLTRYTGLGASGFWLALVTGLSVAALLLGLRTWQRQRLLRHAWA